MPSAKLIFHSKFFHFMKKIIMQFSNQLLSSNELKVIKGGDGYFASCDSGCGVVCDEGIACGTGYFPDGSGEGCWWVDENYIGHRKYCMPLA